MKAEDIEHAGASFVNRPEAMIEVAYATGKVDEMDAYLSELAERVKT